MSHLTLIRHGQANSAATDETGYDRLSPLGKRQAEWLGAHLGETRDFHPRIFSGTLRRHVETAEGLGLGDTTTQDERLNELAYFTLAECLADEHGIPTPAQQADFVNHLPTLFHYWSEDRLSGAPESFATFEARVSGALEDISSGDGPALVITSGGVIAVSIRKALGLDIAATARTALAIMNSSMHRLFPIGGTLTPTLFNAVPHLDKPDRHHARTHV